MIALTFLTTALLLTAYPTATAAVAGCRSHAQCSTPSSTAYCWRGACYPFTRPSIPVPLAFLKQQVNASPMSTTSRRTFLAIASATIRDFNPHLHIYRTIHNFDPLPAFHSLAASQTDGLPEYDFHVNVSRIFHKMNDLHTRYIPPAPLNGTASLLGFTLSIAYKHGKQRPLFYVSDIVPGFSFPDKDFSIGVRVTHFDGVPVRKLALRLGRAGYAANTESARAFGRDALTTRVALLNELPEEAFVTLRFRAGKTAQEMRVPWVLVALTGGEFLSTTVRYARTGGAPPNSVNGPFAAAAHMNRRCSTPIKVVDEFVDVLSASVRHSAKGDIGVLTLPSFRIRASANLLAELARLLALMPARGLVVDVRGNSGGWPDYAKAVTEMISGVSVPRMPMQIRASEALESAFSDPDGALVLQFILGTFRAANLEALKLGKRLTARVSDVLSFFSPVALPRQARVYKGPVVTVTDAQVFSAGDVFALLQKDLGASLVVGIDGTTAAGGAWQLGYRQFQAGAPNVIKKELPGNADFLFTFGSFYRVGKRTGDLVEHFGIEPDVRYYPTRNDLINDDEDLFDFVAGNLVPQHE